MMNQDKIKLALAVLSGRLVNLDNEKLKLLGFNTYNFWKEGKLSSDEIKIKAENIIYEQFEILYHKYLDLTEPS